MIAALYVDPFGVYPKLPRYLVKLAASVTLPRQTVSQ